MEATRQEQVRRGLRQVSQERDSTESPTRWAKQTRFGQRFDRYKLDKKIISWDVAPKQDYFDELFRISRNQIIWGGNYFYLPPTRCFLVWKKHIPENFSMAMCEYAWTSFNANAKVFEYPSIDNSGMRFHPTQKPIELYDWILRNYAEPGYKILDTHVGSASSLIACKRLNFDFVGFEIDKEYYRLACERIARETAQMTLTQYLGEMT